MEAPLIMEFRKARDESDEANDSCDQYNGRKLHALALEKSLPVARFTAAYSGISCEAGKEIADDLFGGLPHAMELCEGAPVIYLHNLWVAAGLMNGTRGTVRAIVYRYGDRPDHADPQRRLPAVVLVECPSYAGEAFFDFEAFPERRQWIPFFPRDIKLELDGGTSRSQLALTLAWALTPWKAQGMSLEKVVVNLGKAASKPGVAFVALTRVRHPHGLALDDNFPAYATFQKQLKNRTFVQRQHFERLAKARFSDTLRRSMRDAAIYSAANVWTQDDADVAHALLRLVASRRNLPDAQVPAMLAATAGRGGEAIDAGVATRVWERLLTQHPHTFAVARARGTLATHTPPKDASAAAVASLSETQATQLSYKGWVFARSDLQLFVDTAQMPPAILELFSKILQATCAPVTPCEAPSAKIANVFWLTHKDKHRDRLRGLVRSGGTVVAPMLRADTGAWIACTVTTETTATETEVRCVVSHGAELDASALQQLQTTVETTFLARRVTFSGYDLAPPRGHVVALLAILVAHLRTDPATSERVRENFTLCAHDAHQSLVDFSATLLRITREASISDVAAAAARDADLA